MAGDLHEQTKNFEHKVKDISDYLRTNVLSPAEQERDRIIAEANAEKDRIVAQAEKKAEQIVQAAEEKARRTIETAESSLRIAARQAIDTLKIALEKEVLSRIVGGKVRETLSDRAVMKELLGEVVRQTVASGMGQVSLTLSDDLRRDLGDTLKKDIAVQATGGITLSDETVPSGFVVKFVDKGFAYEFTHDAVRDLLGDLLRSDLREYLFK